MEEKKLDILANIFKMTPDGVGGTVIDSGSTFTYLVKDAFNALNAEVRKLRDGLIAFASRMSSTTPATMGLLRLYLLGFQQLPSILKMELIWC